MTPNHAADDLDESNETDNASAVEPSRDPITDADELTQTARYPITITPETAAAIASRLGDTVADDGEPVTWQTVRDMLFEYVDLRARVRVDDVEKPLAEFVTEVAEVPVHDSDDVPPALAGFDEFDAIVTAHTLLEQVDRAQLDETAVGQLRNALDELDTILLDGVKDGHLEPVGERTGTEGDQ